MQVAVEKAAEKVSKLQLNEIKLVAGTISGRNPVEITDVNLAECIAISLGDFLMMIGHDLSYTLMAVSILAKSIKLLGEALATLKRGDKLPLYMVELLELHRYLSVSMEGKFSAQPYDTITQAYTTHTALRLPIDSHAICLTVVFLRSFATLFDLDFAMGVRPILRPDQKSD